MLGSFAGKLTEVQNNEAASWLPANAESTRALEKMEPFQDPNAIPTTVVYEKASGLTPDDLAKLKEQAAELQAMDNVEGKVIGPVPSKDGQVAQTVVTYNLGANGWNEMPAIAEEIHEIADLDEGKIYLSGVGGSAVDSFEAFEGLDSTLLLAALGVVILLLLLTYRSPILWILPIFSVVVALGSSLGLIYFLAKYADLTVNGQSQAIVSILVLGAGTDYALLLVARYREELRRHEDRHEAMAFALHRATPAIIASAGTVIVGMLCLTLADMNSTAGMGPVVRDRRRRGSAGDDHAAARAARDLRSVDVLAEAARLRLARAHLDRGVGEGGRVHRPPAAQGLDGHDARAGHRRPRRPHPDTKGLSTEESYTKEFASVTGQKVLTSTAWPTPPRRRWWWPTPTRPTRWLRP